MTSVDTQRRIVSLTALLPIDNKETSNPPSIVTSHNEALILTHPVLGDKFWENHNFFLDIFPRFYIVWTSSHIVMYEF